MFLSKLTHNNNKHKKITVFRSYVNNDYNSNTHYYDGVITIVAYVTYNKIPYIKRISNSKRIGVFKTTGIFFKRKDRL